MLAVEEPALAWLLDAAPVLVHDPVAVPVWVVVPTAVPLVVQVPVVEPERSVAPAAVPVSAQVPLTVPLCVVSPDAEPVSVQAPDVVPWWTVAPVAVPMLLQVPEAEPEAADDGAEPVAVPLTVHAPVVLPECKASPVAEPVSAQAPDADPSCPVAPEADPVVAHEPVAVPEPGATVYVATMSSAPMSTDARAVGLPPDWIPTRENCRFDRSVTSDGETVRVTTCEDSDEAVTFCGDGSCETRVFPSYRSRRAVGVPVPDRLFLRTSPRSWSDVQTGVGVPNEERMFVPTLLEVAVAHEPSGESTGSSTFASVAPERPLELTTASGASRSVDMG